ncbi:FAD-binding and (Fe-S)-binding domain-containing protein [Fluviispira vulneris]|uniref:FAD-binding and (Fe-S)-binding domain-containing protein n=1 Tax=Fluviispira vulneris TaxID=2763012 RepID=UPI0016481253|nr:FAD-binding and (Fe-S)-binding domain-containing protein [Fluviispira vulneris]
MLENTFVAKNSHLPNLFLKEINSILPKNRIHNDPLYCNAYAHDASHYVLIPKLVLVVDTENEVQKILSLCRKFQVPLTFRAAGSSLSGQAITDSVLLVLSWKWRKHTIFNDGKEISLQPGVIGKDANLYLAKYNRKIGPDPSSIDFAKIGGIAANNASGMCCGVKNNSYNTMKTIRIILNDGTVLDTGDPESIKIFRETHKKLLSELLRIQSSIKRNDNLVNKIRAKYSIKNTVGYAINSFLDFTDPIDILSHLMIGSEGTLGFISEITYTTIHEEKYKKASLCFFKNIRYAMEAVLRIKDCETSAVEFMDNVSLNCTIEHLGEFMPKEFDPSATSALIIEIRSDSERDLSRKLLELNEIILNSSGSMGMTEFYADEKYKKILKIRKEILPIVQGNRSANAMALLEDIAFPIEKLPIAIDELKDLFIQHNYEKTCLFGHAKDGNLHFIMELDFASKESIKNYELFMENLAKLVVEKHNGSLKAEHGTGRNIAPFVAMEWGEEANAIMFALKNIIDPEFILNPDVILSSDKKIHLKNLKTMQEVNNAFDKCTECGACERICPSYGLSLTPRQRIVSLRTMHEFKVNMQYKILKTMQKKFKYHGSDTCAASGMCAVVCPVGIDTGKVIKNWRAEQQNIFKYIFWSSLAQFHAITNFIAKYSLKLIGKID